MHPALPRETASSARAGHRAPLLALLAGSVIAGFGLGALGLAMLLPAPQPSALPLPPESRVSSMVAPASPGVRGWPAAFGTAPEIAPVQWTQPEDMDVVDDALPFVEADYRLRGVVIEDDGGWALVQSPTGIEVVSAGSALSGGETIVSISQHGVVLEEGGLEFLLAFGEFDLPTTAVNTASRRSNEARTRTSRTSDRRDEDADYVYDDDYDYDEDDAYDEDDYNYDDDYDYEDDDNYDDDDYDNDAEDDQPLGDGP